MDKILRKLVILSIIFGIIVIILSSSVNATNLEYNPNGYTFDDYSMFKYNNIFCVELGQNVGSGKKTYTNEGTYEYKDKTLYINGKAQTMDKNLIEFCNGLAYILSTEIGTEANMNVIPPVIKSTNRDKNEDRPIYVSGDDPRQLALWKYFETEKDYSEILGYNYGTVYVEDDSGNAVSKLETGDNTLKHRDFKGNNYNINYTPSSEAYTLYENALSVRTQINGSFNIYLLTCNDGESSQKLWLVKASSVQPLNIIIKKIDSQNYNILPEVKFKVELTNVASIKDYQIPTTGKPQNSPTVVYLTTDSNGCINLKGILPKDATKEIEVTITEEEAPSTNGTYYYEKLKNSIKIKIIDVNGTYSATTSSTDVKEINTSNNSVNVTVKNQPLIDLSGNVWKDDQIGEKKVSGPNGLKDSGESSIKDVIVELYSIEDKEVIATTTTDENGNYKFENINKTNDGYKIIFKYNGIKYNATTTEPGISKGTEPDRTEFNNDFKTISEGKSNNVEGLTYTYSDEKSVLNATKQGHTTGTTDAKFQISAETPVYTNTTDNANLGLVERYFDLSIGTDVKSAKLKINDREIEYSYAQIMDGKMEDLTLDKILQNNSSTAENIKYNLYLYTSDYNYRISDYKIGITNNVDSGDEGKTDNQIISEAVDNQTINKEQELEAYVTYSIILKNQSTHDATVDEFVYYYDKAYIPQFKNGDVIDGYRVVSIDEDKIKFEKVNDNVVLSENNSYRKEIDLTFKVNGDERGIVAIKENCTNIAEITKYSTNEGGLIDNDSAPGNADVKFENGTPKIGQYEDDTDQAKGLKISLKDESRTITGTVFEDLNKDGVSNDNKQVKDVIVQLIEIKTINGKNREYIWQETRSGSNTVKTTARNGYPGETYPNSVEPGSGMYEFKDYIPGNYIIRYIYGDGTTYDITDNVKKYNGQDYKSTKDEHYQAEWYNKVNYKQYASVARDNEARRLKVMAYSTMIEKTNGNNLVEMNAEALEGTWMAAETSKLNVPIDSNTTPTEKSTVLYDTMNFGLALRPETKLVLEKHITGLKITPSGTGVQPIVDARANIEQVINEGKIDTTGVTTGLATIKSDRSERGFWKVETDIEELAQGAQLEVEYTYVIRNDSDEDYLSSNLVENYINSIEDGNYAKYLTSKASEVKTNTKGQTQRYGKYLGQYYYTGNKGQNDIEVLSRVEELEEALNNQFKYDETVAGEDFEKINTEAVSKNIYDTDGNPGTRNIETVVKTRSVSDFLTRVKTGEEYHDDTIKDENENDVEVIPNADYSKTLKLTTVLTSFNNGAGYYPSYIAEITKYSNAAGRRNMNAEPANLSYVHSEDTGKTMETDNEVDEFWGEQIIISKPTGFNKQLAIQIVIIAISSIAVIGVGIVLIKKFVLKK